MKKILPAIAAYLILCDASYAAATIYENDALGFRLSVSPQSDDILICAADAVSCLTFNPDGPEGTFTEETGKCTFVMEHFSYDFADGRTNSEFMLTLSGQVVRVIAGEDACQLEQDSPRQMRGLTGIYQ